MISTACSRSHSPTGVVARRLGGRSLRDATATRSLASHEDEDSATPRVQVAFGERERFADPQPGTPQHDNQPAEPHAVQAIVSGAHHRDDLLNCRRVRRVEKPFVPW